MSRVLFLLRFTWRNGAYLGGNVTIKVLANVAWGYFHYANTKFILDRYPGGVAGVSHEELMMVNILAVFGTILINMFLEQGWRAFARRVEDGSIDQDLLKPQSIYYTLLLYRIRLPPLGRLIVVVPALLLTMSWPLPYGDGSHFALALVMFGVGMVGMVLFHSVAHLLLFRWPHLTNITDLTGYVSGLFRTPATIFAQSVHEIALTFIPSIFMVSVPVMILYRGISWELIGTQILGVVVLALIAKVSYPYALKLHGSAG